MPEECENEFAVHVRERFDLETASWRLQEAEEDAEAALIATPEEQTEIYVRLVRSKLDSSNLCRVRGFTLVDYPTSYSEAKLCFLDKVVPEVVELEEGRLI